MRAFVTRRDRYGGPAPSVLDAALDGYADELADLRTQRTAAANRLADADQALAERFQTLKETA